MSRVWVLGAADPEMDAIESLLLECGERVAYALDESGARVSSASATRAHLPPLRDARTVCLVGCDISGAGLLRVCDGTARSEIGWDGVPLRADPADPRPVLAAAIAATGPGFAGSRIAGVISALARLAIVIPALGPYPYQGGEPQPWLRRGEIVPPSEGEGGWGECWLVHAWTGRDDVIATIPDTIVACAEARS